MLWCDLIFFVFERAVSLISVCLHIVPNRHAVMCMVQPLHTFYNHAATQTSHFFPFFSLEKQNNWLKLFYFKSVARTITSIVLLPSVRSIGLRKHSCGATPKNYRAPGLFSCSKALLDDGFLS